MSRCKNCGVEILDRTDTCPLCHCVLEQGGQSIEVPQTMYPGVRGKVRRYRFWQNLLFFLSIVIESILIGINVLVGTELWWSLIVGMVLVYGNVLLQLAIAGRSSYEFKSVSLTIFAVLIMIGIDYLTGYRGWAINYVLPSGILFLDVGILILMMVNRRNWQSYMMSQIITILLSVVPVALLLLGYVTFPYLAVIAQAASVFLFLGTLIIGDQRARTELKRRFHL